MALKHRTSREVELDLVVVVESGENDDDDDHVDVWRGSSAGRSEGNKKRRGARGNPNAGIRTRGIGGGALPTLRRKKKASEGGEEGEGTGRGINLQ